MTHNSRTCNVEARMNGGSEGRSLDATPNVRGGTNEY